MKTLRSWIPLVAYSLSATAHAALLLSPPNFQRAVEQKAEPSLVQFVVAEPEKPAPPAEPEPKKNETEEPPQPPVVEPSVPTPPSTQESEPEPDPPEDASSAEEPQEEAPAPEEPAAEQPPELSGTTLTSEGEGAFSAEVGSGRSRSGAISAGISRARGQGLHPTPTPTRPKIPQAPPPPPVEALKNLLKRPSPPPLADALRRNYPAAARAQGKSGEAKVRARVDADGRIRKVRILSESSSGFGRSCEKTLEESRWSAPVSRSGEKVATWISYRCSFRVDD